MILQYVISFWKIGLVNKKDGLKGCQKIGVQNSPASGAIPNRDYVIDCNDSFVLKRKKMVCTYEGKITLWINHKRNIFLFHMSKLFDKLCQNFTKSVQNSPGLRYTFCWSRCASACTSLIPSYCVLVLFS